MCQHHDALPRPLPTFDTVGDAYDWMYAEVDDPCVDNERFAWADQPEELATYDAVRDEGCCGSFDSDVIIGGRRAVIGCNYGH